MKHPRVLWLKGVAGLGNWLLAYAAGTTYARITHRCLFLDWRDHVYSNGIRNVFFDAFESVGPSYVSVADEHTTDVFPPCWVGQLGQPKQCLPDCAYRQTSIAFDDFDRREHTVVGWSYSDQWTLLKKVFANVDRKQALRRMLGALRLTDKMRNALAQHMLHMNFEECHVALNYRNSDIKALTPIEQCCDAVAEITEGPVFMATDCRAALDVAVTRFGSRLRHLPKWYPPHGERMHGNTACPDRHTNFTNAVLELYLLSRCDTIVASPVSFKGKPSGSSFRLVAEVLPESTIKEVVLV